jgi:hypothetical protein
MTMYDKPIFLSEDLVTVQVYDETVTGLVLFRSFCSIELAVVHPYRMLFENWLIPGFAGGTWGLFGPAANRHIKHILHSSHIAALHLSHKIPEIADRLRSTPAERDRFLFRVELALPPGSTLSDRSWQRNVSEVYACFGHDNSAYPWNTPILRRSHQHQADVLLYRALMGDPVDLRSTETPVP